MAEKLNFILEFENAQRSLKNVVNEVKQQFKGIKLDIEPNVRRTTAGGRTASGPEPRGGAKLLSDLAKAREKSKQAEEKFVAASDKRVVNLGKIVALQEKGLARTAQQDRELKGLINSAKALRGSETRFGNSLDRAESEVSILTQTFKALSSVANAVASGLFQAREGGLTEIDITGFQGGLDILENLVNKVIRDVFVPLGSAGAPAAGIRESLTTLVAKISEETDIFGKLGFSVEDGQKLIRAGIDNFVSSLQRAGINAVQAAQQGGVAEAPPRVDSEGDRINREIAVANAKQASFARAAAESERRISEVQQTIATTLERRAQTQEAIARQTERVKAKEAIVIELTDKFARSLLDTSGVNDTLQDSIIAATKIWSDNEGLLTRQRTVYASQNKKLEQLTSVQERIRLSLGEQAVAAQQAAASARQQAATLAQAGSPDLGPTRDTGRAEREAAFATQLKEGEAAVVRFRTGLFNAIESTDGYSRGARLITRTIGEANRIQENAGVAQSVVSQELLAQSRAIRESTLEQINVGTITQEQIAANIRAANQLNKTAGELELLSRPIVGVGERADKLAITLGQAAGDVVRGISGLTGGDLSLAIQGFREIFESEGGDIEASVTKFVQQLSTITEVTASPREALKILENSLKTASDASLELADAQKQFADSRRGQASADLRGDATTGLNEAQKGVIETLRRVSRNFRGAGTAAAEFVDGAPFVSLEQGLENVKAGILAALDPGKITFLQDAGVDINTILENSIVEAGRVFKNEFGKESKKIARILDAAALKGANNLVRDLKDATPTKLLDPDFLEKAFESIQTEFPRLTEGLINDIVAPLRKQIKRAADSRAKTDSELESLRQEQIQAEQELVRSINDAFQSQDLQESVGSGGLARANEALTNAILGTVGKIRNAFNKEEEAALDSASVRRDIVQELLDGSRASVEAEQANLTALKQLANSTQLAGEGTVIAQRRLNTENQNLEEEIAKLTRQIRGADAFNLDNLTTLQSQLADAEAQRLQNSNDILGQQDLQRGFAGLSAQRAGAVAEKEAQIAIIAEDVLREERNLATATKEAADITKRRNRRARSGSGNDAVGGQGPLRDFSAQSIQDFGQSLDLRSQARFVELLKKEETSLKTVNIQLKSHQGNIAKSNQTVDDLTASMTSGQRAAFQFGFAAANAADRLAAWATPAAFIFGAISSLREALGVIIKLDTEIGRIAFFNSDTLDRISAGILGLSDSLGEAGSEAEFTKGAFDKLNTSTERLEALTIAAANAQEFLIDRSIQTGIELTKLSEIALVAGRVGREAFTDTGVAPFAEAIEGLVRIEGASANAAELTAQLNSVLNQFSLEAQDAGVVAARLAEVSQRTGFSAGELAEGMTRVAGAFAAVQRATPAETLEFLAVAGNTAQTSVARVSTALRQFSVRVAAGADEIKEFADLDIVEDGKLKGPLALVEVLETIGSFEGQDAAIEFITRFTDQRNASILLSLARGAGKLRENIAALGKDGDETNSALRAQAKFLAAVADQSRRLESRIEKLRTGVVKLVAQSGFTDFLGDTVSLGGKAIGIFSAFVGAIGGIGKVFAIVAAIALPTLLKIVQGFRAGLLPSQKQAEAINKIVTALNQEKNIIDAIQKAEAQNLVSKEKAALIASEALGIAARQKDLQIQINNLIIEEGALRKADIKDITAIDANLEKQKNLQAQINAELAKENNLRGRAAQIIQDPTTGPGFGERFTKNLGANIGRAFIVGATIGGPIASKLFGDAIEKETKEAFATGIQGAIAGGSIGAAFGPIGALIGAITVATLSLINLQSELAERREEETRVLAKQELTRKRQFELKKIRDANELVIRGKISNREQAILLAKDEIERLEIRLATSSKETAKNEALVERIEKGRFTLNRLLLQSKKLENEQLARSILFEEKITTNKRQQAFLTQTNNLLAKAQIALLEQTSDQPILEIQIRAEVDRRNLSIQRGAIEKDLALLKNRIIEIGVESANAQEIKKLEKRRLDLQNNLTDLELATIDARFEVGKALLAEQEAAADNEIEKFKTIGGFLRDAFSDLVGSQERIIDLIREEANVFENIAELQNEAADSAARGQRAGAVRDITDLNIRQQKDIINRRNKIIEDGARKTVELLARQFEELGQIPTFSELSESAETLKSNINAVGGPLAQFRDNLNRTQRLQLAKIESDRQIFDLERGQALRGIELRKSQLQQENDVSRAKIALVNDEIAIIRERLDKEAQLGDKLINTPEQFIKEARSIFGAQNVLRAARVDATNVEEGLNRVIQEITKTFGVGALKPILDGLKAAQERGQEIVEGVLPAQLTSLFQRLVFNRNSKLEEASISKQQELLNEIGALFGEIKTNNQAQLKLITAQEEIEKLLRETLPELGRQQIDAIREGTATAKLSADAAIAAADFEKQGFNSLNESILALKTELLEKINITDGDTEIRDAVKKVADILNVIADANPDVKEARKDSKALKDALVRAQQLASGEFGDKLKREFTTFSQTSLRDANDRNSELKRTIEIESKKLVKLSAQANLLQKITAANQQKLEDLQFGGTGLQAGGFTNPLNVVGAQVDALELALRAAFQENVELGGGGLRLDKESRQELDELLKSAKKNRIERERLTAIIRDEAKNFKGAFQVREIVRLRALFESAGVDFDAELKKAGVGLEILAQAAALSADRLARQARTSIGEGFADGGRVPGVGNRDNVPALLTPGEFVINKRDTKKNLRRLIAINQGREVGFARGGLVKRFQDGGLVQTSSDDIPSSVLGSNEIVNLLKEIIATNVFTADEITALRRIEEAKNIETAGGSLNRQTVGFRSAAAAERVARETNIEAAKTVEIFRTKLEEVTKDLDAANFLGDIAKSTLQEPSRFNRSDSFVQDLEKQRAVLEGGLRVSEEQLSLSRRALGSANKLLEIRAIFLSQGRDRKAEAQQAQVDRIASGRRLFDFGDDLDPRELAAPDPRFSPEAAFANAVESARADILRKGIVSGADARDRPESLQQAIANTFNDPLARQIAAMEKIVASNESIAGTGNLDAETLSVLKDNLQEAKQQFSLQQGSDERLNEIRDNIAKATEQNAALPGLDVFAPTPRRQDSTKAQAEAQKPVTNNLQKLIDQGTINVALFNRLVKGTEEGSKENSKMLKEIAGNQKKEQLASPQLQIDEASRQDFINLFGEKFDEVCNNWIVQFTAAINENPLGVEAAPIELQLNAQVQTEILGDTFITQLTEALVGTGLEDKTDLIVEALAPLLQFHLNNDSGGVNEAGSQVIDLAGARNETRIAAGQAGSR